MPAGSSTGQGSTPHSSSSAAASSTPASPTARVLDLLWSGLGTHTGDRQGGCPDGHSGDQGLSWQQGCHRGAVQPPSPFPREQLLPVAEP